MVTSTGSGLAVPDWPTTFGYNMFLYPWSQMVGGILYEHSHRLAGAVVGFLTLVLAVWLWASERRTWVRWLAAAALATVVIQGVLGGLRVLLLDYTLAIVHACLAQGLFGLAVGLAVFTSREWHEAPPNPWAPSSQATASDGRGVVRLALAAAAAIYLQIVFGAVLRHTGTALGAHLAAAMAVAGLAGALLFRLRRAGVAEAKTLALARTLCGLILVQLVLGVATLVGYSTFLAPARPALATAHVIVGAGVWAASVALSLRALRLFGAPWAQGTAAPEGRS
jgi:cytochrome c oxidase assembly protein subunit 15